MAVLAHFSLIQSLVQRSEVSPIASPLLSPTFFYFLLGINLFLLHITDSPSDFITYLLDLHSLGCYSRIL
jgi:hypothetical protein